MFDGCRKTLLIAAFAAPKSAAGSRMQKVTSNQIRADTGCIASHLQLWIVVGVGTLLGFHWHC